ncbi:hypothetical protein GGR56DRAFT_223686 [Xylariaceae sp. FL0804]|nr:hypothetical protein GGR56DRAFT_223686 [Xylariaceae sp. FL0804]
MALNVKHLNQDASFLLTFEPVLPEFTEETVVPRPFTILLDPWITGPSKIFHPKISVATHKHPACISSLAELPQPPDLVIVSQHKSDHCNEATLRQLPASGTNTLILAEPAAARLIRSWKYFAKDAVRTIEKWEDPRASGKQTVVRLPVPALATGGAPGEVTVAFVSQKRDLAGLHSAIGITYRPPSPHQSGQQQRAVRVFTPPTTPDSATQTFLSAEGTTPVSTPTGTTFALPPSPPLSPRSLRSVKSASTLISSPVQTSFRPSTSSGRNDPHAFTRPISVLFSPHGISYESIAPYVTSHLVAEAALPLSALLHCMDSISSPWWLGGNICAGVPYGAEIATKLGAKVWVSAHDGEKDVQGLATAMLKTRRWRQEDIEGAMNPDRSKPPGDAQAQRQDQHRHRQRAPDGGVQSARSGGHTVVLRMGCGDEVLVSGAGLLWRSNEDDQWKANPNTTTTTTTTTSATAAAEIPTLKPSPSIKGSKEKRANDLKRTPSRQQLPKVQNSMTPNKLAVFKALKTMDLLKPSPKLELAGLQTPPPPPSAPRSHHHHQHPSSSSPPPTPAFRSGSAAPEDSKRPPSAPPATTNTTTAKTGGGKTAAAAAAAAAWKKSARAPKPAAPDEQTGRTAERTVRFEVVA